MYGEMKGKSPGAAYNRVRLINGILRYVLDDYLLPYLISECHSQLEEIEDMLSPLLNTKKSS